MLTLISYDIADDGDRARAHKLLEGLGQRVQYSVFECYLEPEDLEKLKAKLKPLLRGSFDSVRLYRVCAECAAKAEVLGWGDTPREPEAWII